MKLIAHRGIHNNKDIPENSMLSFKKAIKLNYPIELDVQLTKDNVLVVFHDENLKRMTGYDEKVNNLTYKQLKQLKLLNTNETIPTLNEALNLINGKVDVYIEIKPSKKIKNICNKVYDELNKYNYKHIIQSFSPRIVRWFSKNSPETYSGLLINKKIYNSLLGKTVIKYSKSKFLSVSKKVLSDYENRKYPIIIWTIQDNNELNKYKEITDTLICNNLPLK